MRGVASVRRIMAAINSFPHYTHLLLDDLPLAHSLRSLCPLLLSLSSAWWACSFSCPFSGFVEAHDSARIIAAIRLAWREPCARVENQYETRERVFAPPCRNPKISHVVQSHIFTQRRKHKRTKKQAENPFACRISCSFFLVVAASARYKRKQKRRNMCSSRLPVNKMSKKRGGF